MIEDILSGIKFVRQKIFANEITHTLRLKRLQSSADLQRDQCDSRNAEKRML